MPAWIANVKGIDVAFGASAEPEPRRGTLQFPEGAGDSTGDRVRVFPDAPISIGGTTTQDQLDSIVDALVALGLATDDR